MGTTVERKRPDQPAEVRYGTTDEPELETVNPDELVVGSTPAAFRLSRDERAADHGLAAGEESDRPADRDKARAVDATSSRVGIDDPEAAEALGTAYDVTRQFTAPFVVKVASDMLVDLRSEVENNPHRKVLFIGRDAHCLAIATRTLDPEFFDQCCVEVVLSRALVDSALQDLEKNAGKTFPDLEDFRGAATKVSPGDIDGARMRLTAYLQANDVPVGRAGSEVTIVDTSYKGTVQELLAGLYPATSFEGRYAFFGASPHDPHPGTKTGYALHLEANQSHGGRPVSDLPDDPGFTFSNQDAIAVIEETLHGPLSSPKRLNDDGPVQEAQRADSVVLEGLNPIRVDDEYMDPAVREGVMDINLIAVKDYADQIATTRAHGGDWQAELDSGFNRFRSQVRAWVVGEDSHPEFARVMDSFVRRADKAQVRLLAEAIERDGMTDEDALAVWQAYDRLRTMDDKRAFVVRFEPQREIG